jgi:hypothetical protein
MAEHLRIGLREEEGPQPNPPNLIREIKQLLNEILENAAPHPLPSETVWVKSEEEGSKAREIQTLVMEKLEALEAEREKLLKDRDEVQLKHKERMFELKIERFNAIVRALEVLRSKGIRLTARTTKKIEDALADISEPAGP